MYLKEYKKEFSTSNLFEEKEVLNDSKFISINQEYQSDYLKLMWNH